MKAVIQVCRDARVDVEGVTTGAIEHGMLVYFGAEAGDDSSMLRPFLEKMMRLRIFKDERGKMNLSLSQTGGSILLVSQFTLAADVYKGNRPGFETALDAGSAEKLYEEAVSILRGMGYTVSTGVFGAHMLVSYTNDGPETFILDSQCFLHR